MTMKILNLYSGIGGNRRLWDGDIEVTAVEWKPEIAKVYQDFFPNDKVVIGDAHAYLLEHYEEFDFIWASPPCPSHSMIRMVHSKNDDNCKPIYPDMKLYEEIILLQHYFKGKWVVENVVSYYDPLIKPQKLQRHYFWSNFYLSDIRGIGDDSIVDGNIEVWQKNLGIDLSPYTDIPNDKKGLMLRNCVSPRLGLHIFKMAFKSKQMSLGNLIPDLPTTPETFPGLPDEPATEVTHGEIKLDDN